jgi:hypothetical protein
MIRIQNTEYTRWNSEEGRGKREEGRGKREDRIYLKADS